MWKTLELELDRDDAVLIGADQENGRIGVFDLVGMMLHAYEVVSYMLSGIQATKSSCIYVVGCNEMDDQDPYCFNCTMTKCYDECDFIGNSSSVSGVFVIIGVSIMIPSVLMEIYNIAAYGPAIRTYVNVRYGKSPWILKEFYKYKIMNSMNYCPNLFELILSKPFLMYGLIFFEIMCESTLLSRLNVITVAVSAIFSVMVTSCNYTTNDGVIVLRNCCCVNIMCRIILTIISLAFLSFCGLLIYTFTHVISDPIHCELDDKYECKSCFKLEDDM